MIVDAGFGRFSGVSIRGGAGLPTSLSQAASPAAIASANIQMLLPHIDLLPPFAWLR